MICTKLAKKILTKKEQRHLTKAGVNSMEAFRRTRAIQIEIKNQVTINSRGIEPCFECKHIARKLGIE